MTSSTTSVPSVMRPHPVEYALAIVFAAICIYLFFIFPALALFDCLYSKSLELKKKMLWASAILSEILWMVLSRAAFAAHWPTLGACLFVLSPLGSWGYARIATSRPIFRRSLILVPLFLVVYGFLIAKLHWGTLRSV